jgi:hypothetical protein
LTQQLSDLFTSVELENEKQMRMLEAFAFRAALSAIAARRVEVGGPSCWFSTGLNWSCASGKSSHLAMNACAPVPATESSVPGLVVVTFSQARLGMYLEPCDGQDDRGAAVCYFEDVEDGRSGEAEASGLIKPGFTITRIAGSEVAFAPFATIIDLLISSDRPLSVVFRDPERSEIKDRFGFPRTKLHVELEAAFFRSHADSQSQLDMAWLRFLQQLGGAGGAQAGVGRLLRDANGEVHFPARPFERLSALTPAGDLPATVAPLAIPVIDIYKRCWSVGSPSTLPIGVSVPPGLGASGLPGAPPPLKQRQALAEALARLLIRGGCPAAFRASIWFELSGARAKAALHPSGYYASLLCKRPDAAAAAALAKDVDRTFPGHAFFAEPAGLACLTRVLSAFAVNNPAIGYCQSLNFLAGFLLVVLPEEHAFWVLEVLATEILPPQYFDDGLLGMFADQRVLTHLLGEVCPDVAAAVTAAGIELHTVTVEWMMCLMCTALPTHAALRLWDVVWVCGVEAVFRITLALFHANRERILSITSSATRTCVTVAVDAAKIAAAGEARVAAAGAGSPAPVSVRVQRVAPAGPVPGSAPAGPLKPAALRGASAGVAADNCSGISTRSTALGVGQDSLELDKAVSAAVAASLLSATESTATLALGESLPAGSGSNPTLVCTVPVPIFRGGTVRQGAALFPAVYQMLKALPATAAAHDVDGLMRIAFPATETEARALRCPAWDRLLNSARLSKLRCVGPFCVVCN